MNFKKVEADLRARLTQIEERLAHVTKDISSSHSADSGEQAVERENDEVLEGIGQEAQTTIQHIRAALSMAGQNKSRAAALLGISRTTLYRKLDELALLAE